LPIACGAFCRFCLLGGVGGEATIHLAVEAVRQ
jgi:hypothetical protein